MGYAGPEQLAGFDGLFELRDWIFREASVGIPEHINGRASGIAFAIRITAGNEQTFSIGTPRQAEPRRFQRDSLDDLLRFGVDNHQTMGVVAGVHGDHRQSSRSSRCVQDHIAGFEILTRRTETPSVRQRIPSWSGLRRLRSQDGQKGRENQESFESHGLPTKIYPANGSGITEVFHSCHKAD